MGDLKEPFKGARKSKLEYVKSTLDEPQKFLLGIIEKRHNIDSGDLFRLCKDPFHDPLCERAYRNHMKHLVRTELVKESGEGRWKKFEVV